MNTVTRLVTSVLVTVLLMVATTVAADPDTAYYEGWKKAVIVDITTTQTSYSNSWVGGEAGSVNWVANLNGEASRYLKEWLELQSRLRLSFGQTITQDAETKDWSKPKKSTDLIDWETVALLDLHAYVEPYGAFRLESQFYDGRNPNQKLYLSPIKLTESAGIARRLYKKDKNVISSRLGLGLRQIMTKGIVDSAVTAAGTEYTTESVTTTDGGLESVTDVKMAINEKLMYTGKLSLFKAFFYSEKDEVAGTEFEDDWKAIDINWENIVSASITKIITVNLYTQLLYDKQVSKKGRFKETLGIGFVFKMF